MSVLRTEEMRRERVTGWVRCVCTRTCLFSLWICVGLLCVWVYFLQPGCALPPLTRPLLFSSPPDRQCAGAPPQSFIGSYYPLTQIQYASIDCVEKQSGSPQQRSKQSKFNKTPPPAFSLALIAPPTEEQMYLCEWIETDDRSRGHRYC